MGGFNLNSPECLYSTFVSPWADSPARRDPDFLLPMCYFTSTPAMKPQYLHKFREDTLIYVFYNMPRDSLQLQAARELYSRNWRYHKEFKLWFTGNPDSAKDGAPMQYIYFDINAW